MHNQKAHRNAAMQGVEFAFVSQQLDDDDGGRKSQRNRNIEGLDHRPPKQHNDHKAPQNREGELP